MVVRDQPLALERGGDRCVERLGERDHVAPDVLRTMAQHDERPLGRSHHRERVCHVVARRQHDGAAHPPFRPLGVRIGRDGLDVVREDQVRHVLLDDRRLAGERRELGMIGAGEHGLRERGDRREGRGEVNVLKGTGAEDLGLHLPGECQDRCPIDLGVPEPGQEVGGTGAGDGQAGGGLAGQLAVGRAGEGGRTLVANAVIAHLASDRAPPECIGET